MCSFLGRILHKISIDTLFTPFRLQINKLEEEKRETKSDQLENFEIYTFIIILKKFEGKNSGETPTLILFL